MIIFSHLPQHPEVSHAHAPKCKNPHEEFNQAARNGTVGQKVRRILADTKPEAVYFTEQNGQGGAILIIDLSDPSQVPAG
jgi:hypothetical protein